MAAVSSGLPLGLQLDAVTMMGMNHVMPSHREGAQVHMCWVQHSYQASTDRSIPSQYIMRHYFGRPNVEMTKSQNWGNDIGLLCMVSFVLAILASTSSGVIL